MTINDNHTDTHFYDYTVHFNCNVEATYVIFYSAPLVNGTKAEFNNCTFSEVLSNGYGLWIKDGSDVTVNGGSFNANRAIKITDEDVDAPELTTLTVSGADFNSAKKAAILVASLAGAEIKVENINIDDVAADSTNAVWVDSGANNVNSKKYTDCAGLVTVAGGTKILESDVATDAEELKTAIDAGAKTVYISGNIQLTEGLTADNVTLIGINDSAAVSFGGHNIVGNGGTITYKNLALSTISLPRIPENGERYGWYGGIDYVRHSVANYENCTISSVFTTYSETVNITGCTFNPYIQDGEEFYHIFVYGSKTVNVSDSTFYYADRAIKIYNEGGSKNIEFNISDSKFLAAEGAKVNEALINVDASLMESVKLTIKNITVDEALTGVKNYSGECQ